MPPDISSDAMDKVNTDHAGKRTFLRTPMMSIGEQQDAGGSALVKPTSVLHETDGAEEEDEKDEGGEKVSASEEGHDDRDRREQEHSVSDDAALARAAVSDWHGSSLDDKDGQEDSVADPKAETVSVLMLRQHDH